MKYLLLLLALSSCDYEFDVEGVQQPHIIKAETLCELNGGIYKIWFAYTTNQPPYVYRISVACKNEAEFKLSWKE